MRLLIVSGQKGGVGKTLFAQAITAWYRREKIGWSGVDTDQENQLFAHLNPDEVVAQPLYDISGRLLENVVDDIINRVAAVIDRENATLVIDMGAGQLQTVLAALHETGLAREIGAKIRLTLAYVILEEQQSLSTLANNLTVLDDLPSAKWIVVKNERDGKLASYDNGQFLKPELARRGAIEMTMPKVPDPGVFRAVSQADVRLEDFARAETNADWATRGRVRTWLEAMYSQFDARTTDLTSIQALTHGK